MNISLFECDIVKLGTGEIVETVHCMANNLFQASHQIVEYMWGDDSRFTIPIEMGAIRKLMQVTNIINPYYAVEQDEDGDSDEDGEKNFNGNLPIQVAKNMMDDEVMKFNCPKCQDEIKVPQQMLFPFVSCSTCGEDIYRSTIKNVGGIYIVDKKSDNNKT